MIPTTPTLPDRRRKSRLRGRDRMTIRLAGIGLLLVLGGCDDSPGPPWSEMNLPMFRELDVERSSEDSLTLRFDPETVSEPQLMTRVTTELASIEWVKIADESTASRQKAQFARTPTGDRLSAYTGHGVLVLDLLRPFPDQAARIAAARRSPADKRADVARFARLLDQAAARAGSGAAIPTRCPDERLRRVVPAGMSRRLPVYATDEAGNVSRLIGGRPIPRPDLAGADLEDAWVASQRAAEAHAVLVVYHVDTDDAELVDATTFRGGSGAARFVVAEVQSGEPLCSGGFAAFNSLEVRADSGDEDSALRADLSRNAGHALDSALQGMSSYLRFTE
jgi:hypothetical protein